ncbi:MAG TPA: hypothetical protein VF173_21555 [Thermoanaerobaculia bacterium]|nr:hypothetical protein [Thermoanaerobaculia bacterium]
MEPVVQRWREMLDQLPRVGMEAAVRLALDRLEPWGAARLRGI